MRRVAAYAPRLKVDERPYTVDEAAELAWAWFMLGLLPAPRTRRCWHTAWSIII